MNSKKNRITIYDLAQELGLAPSTISRALKDENSISDETKKLVWEAADRLGYKKNVLASSLKTRPIKIGIIVRNIFPEFQKLVCAGAKHAEAYLSDYNVTVVYEIIEVDNYKYILPTRIAEMADEGCDGVIFAPPQQESYTLLDSCIAEKGIYASTLYHNYGLKNVNFHVGADYKRSASIAAELMRISGIKKGDCVGYFNGNNSLYQHLINQESFTKYCGDLGYKVAAYSHFDIDKVAETATKELLESHPDVKAIYSSTATCIPIVETILKANLKTKPLIILTELLDTNVSYLKDGIVDAAIFQNPFKMGYLSVVNMYNLIASRKTERTSYEINPHIVIRANLPFYADRITDISIDY